MISLILPKEAREMLVNAANVPVTTCDPLARQMAIESATRKIKMIYPQFFRR